MPATHHHPHGFGARSVRGSRALSPALLVAIALAAPGRASAQERSPSPEPHAVARSALLATGYYAQTEANAAIFAQADDSNSPALLVRAFGFSVRGGHRWQNKALFVSLEAQFWSSPVLGGQRELAMATNLGIGGEFLAAGGLLRTSLALGPSILTIPTSVDSGPSLGFFVDLRPLGLRFPLGGGLLFGIDPLSFTLLMPELSGIPLLEVEYRTSAYLERAL